MTDTTVPPAPAEQPTSAPQPAIPSAPTAPNNGDAAQLAKVESIVAAMVAELPEHLRPLVPSSLSAADRLEWLQTAKKSGLFTAGPAVVPPTDTRPGTGLKTRDPSTLPPAWPPGMGVSEDVEPPRVQQDRPVAAGEWRD